MNKGVQAGGTAILLCGIVSAIILKMLFVHPMYDTHVTVMASSFTGFYAAMSALKIRVVRRGGKVPYILHIFGENHALDEHDLTVLFHIYMFAASMLLGGSFGAALILTLRS